MNMILQQQLHGVVGSFRNVPAAMDNLYTLCGDEGAVCCGVEAGRAYRVLVLACDNR